MSASLPRLCHEFLNLCQLYHAASPPFSLRSRQRAIDAFRKTIFRPYWQKGSGSIPGINPRRSRWTVATLHPISSAVSLDFGRGHPPGSSRRAGGYSPVLRLTADEVSLPYSPVPKSSPSGTRLYSRGGHFGSGPRRSARGRPKAVFLLLACCTQEEDAGSGPHPQHVTPLAFIGPEGIVTVRTGGPRLRPSLQFQIRAIAAKPPRLDLGNLQVYLIDFQLPAFGIEVIRRRQLQDRGRRRALILVGPCLVLPFVIFSFRIPAIDDGSQDNTGLRKCVVWKQPFVRKEIQDLSFVHGPDDLVHRCLLAQQLLESVLEVLVACRVLLNIADSLGESLDPVAQCFPFRGQLLQTSPYRTFQARDVQVRSTRESPNPLARIVGNLSIKHREKPVFHGRAVLLEEGNQVRREPLGPVAALHNVQLRPQFVRKRSFRHAGLYPAIKNVGRELPFQHCGRVQEASRRFHTPLDHLLRLEVEEQVVWPCVGHRQYEGITVHPSGAPHPLEVIAWPRRHRTKRNRREIADVDPHFQRRRAGKQVWIAGHALFVLATEAIFHAFSRLAVKQTGVFLREDTLHVARFVKPAIVVFLGRGPLEVPVAVVPHALAALERRGVVRTDGNREAAILAPELNHARGDLKGGRLQAPNPRSARVAFKDEPCLLEPTQHGLIDRLRRVADIRVKAVERLLQPVLIPSGGGVVGLADQRLEPLTAA